MMADLMAGKPRKPMVNVEQKQPITPALNGIIVKATFKLINVEVSSGGKILSGEATPADAILIGKDLASALELGKSYYVSLT